MKRITCMLALFVLVAAAVGANAAGDANLLGGVKILNLPADLFGGDAERHGDFGIMTSWGDEGWPVWMAVDVMHSNWFVPAIFISGESMTTTEIDAGVRKFFPNSTTRSYIGAGLGLMRVTYELDVWFVGNMASVDKWAAGFWSDAGVLFRLGSHFNLGADMRYSWARVDGVDIDENNSESVNIGGIHLNGFLGFGW